MNKLILALALSAAAIIPAAAMSTRTIGPMAAKTRSATCRMLNSVA